MWVPVTTAWRSSADGGGGLQIWRTEANILYKESRIGGAPPAWG